MGVKRAFQPFKRKRLSVPRAELRGRCESTRLELRALFRSLDRCGLLSDIPAPLRVLMELDADLAEALWVLGQPRGRFDLRAMERDTLASLERISSARDRVLDLLSDHEREELEECTVLVRSHLLPEEAYTDVPGRDPRAG